MSALRCSCGALENGSNWTVHGCSIKTFANISASHGATSWLATVLGLDGVASLYEEPTLMLALSLVRHSSHACWEAGQSVCREAGHDVCRAFVLAASSRQARNEKRCSGRRRPIHIQPRLRHDALQTRYLEQEFSTLSFTLPFSRPIICTGRKKESPVPAGSRCIYRL
jgi:hypothetical protein